MSTVTTTQPQIGDKMEDGTIFIGISPTTARNMFVMPKDAKKFLKKRVALDFNAAAKYAAKLNKKRTRGHEDWRLPTREELEVIWQNKDKGALKGTFDTCWYWSSSSSTRKDGNYAWSRRFNDGQENYALKNSRAAVRCIRQS